MTLQWHLVIIVVGGSPVPLTCHQTFLWKLPVVQDGVKKLDIHQGSGQVLEEYVPPIWYHWLELEV